VGGSKAQAIIVAVLDHSASGFVYGHQVARPEKLVGKLVVLPEIDLFVCGGREEVLSENQEQLFAAGANGILGGNYLTTKGQDPKRDIDMIEGLGLRPVYHSAE